MPVFNIWIEPTTKEEDLTDFLSTSLDDFCDKHKLRKHSADELCADVIHGEYAHLDEDTKKASYSLYQALDVFVMKNLDNAWSNDEKDLYEIFNTLKEEVK